MDQKTLFLVLALLSLVLEATVEFVKVVVVSIQEKKLVWEPVAVFLVAALFYPVLQLDFFAISGVPVGDVHPIYLGLVNGFIFAVIMSRYSGRINDLLNKLEQFTKKA